jgi:hypothetical protein
MSGRWSSCTLFAVAALGACGGDGGTPRDASPDTPGVCAGVTPFTGEVIDWDSTNASFCGVNNATFSVRSDPACRSMTPPNGRFQLMIPQEAHTIVDIAPPTAASGCPGLAGTQGNTYSLPGVAIASAAVIAAGGAFSARAMVQARVATMFTQIGQPLNPSLGQLVVHVNGTLRPVQISANHAAIQVFDGTTWTADNSGNGTGTGRDVFFPNLDLSLGLVIVDTIGPATGTGTYLVEPGKLTYLSIIGN